MSVETDGIRELYSAGRLAEAEPRIEHLNQIRPGDAEVLSLLGLVRRGRGRLDAALEALRQATKLAPSVAEHFNNLALALADAGDFEQAAVSFEKAIELLPGSAPIRHNLGVLLEKTGRFTEAVEAYRQALILSPAYIRARLHLGNALQSLGRFDEAVDAYRLASQSPDAPIEALRQLATAFAIRGDLDRSIELRRRIVERSDSGANDQSELILHLNYGSGVSHGRIAEEARRWGKRFGSDHSPTRSLFPVFPRDRERRLRVGYVSPHFCNHPVGRLIEPVLRCHDRSKFAVYGYSDTAPKQRDSLSGRLQILCDGWRDIQGWDDERFAATVRHDRIDILIDMQGHFHGNRLTAFGRRIAPIQVSHFGYCGTTGLKEMDYRVSDDFSDPPGITDRFHSEKLLRLEGSAWCYRPPVATPEVAPLPAKENGFVTFANINNPIKTCRAALAAWVQILKRVPGSRLCLLTMPQGQAAILNFFESAGIDPGRLILQPPVSPADYFANFSRFDIALDPFPFNGDNTTCDALWMGVPVVTMVGDRFCGRRGFSHLSNVGFASLAAGTIEAYVECAVSLATDLPSLAVIRRQLRQRLLASPLGDETRYVKRLERAYRSMWRQRCDRLDSVV